LRLIGEVHDAGAERVALASFSACSGTPSGPDDDGMDEQVQLVDEAVGKQRTHEVPLPLIVMSPPDCCLSLPTSSACRPALLR